MEKKLTWDQIKECYDQEWVELVDYDWPMNEAEPQSGRVRIHSKDRLEFDRLLVSAAPEDSAVIFVGAPEDPPAGVIPSMNFRPSPNGAK